MRDVLLSFSHEPPPRYTVVCEPDSDMCTVVFCVNVQQIPHEDGIAYVADTISTSAPNSPGLLEDLREHYTDWLKAVEAETSYDGIKI